ncbi:divalent-cation tolerance protein CutA [Luteithermobacter gelatinilyticus]|uniref:divalent-cation tolerance protein CutA n=1 Tax=Luteithermobacter gelatinilyticus TaxID=2582913 RepID=UPI0011065C51|nr:divalent-cation tolerance protein CutA [Luteithermobacter gelatinilyticus]
MTEYCSLYVTCAHKDEALMIARTLVREKLAACGNILDGMTSIYVWQGKSCEDSEVALLLKTTRDRQEAATTRIRELHSYDVPCVVVWPIEGGNPEYLDWISNSLKP